MQRIFKYFKFFLIFILFFNSLFFATLQDSVASSTGIRDRLRSIAREDSFGGLDYSYSNENGFYCKPGGLARFEPTDMTDIDFVNDVIVWFTKMAVSTLYFPFNCWLNYKSILTIKNSTLVGAFGLLTSLFLTSGIDKLMDVIIEYDDYNLDPSNKTSYCQGLYWAEQSLCLVFFAISQIDKFFKKKTKGLAVKLILTVVLSNLFFVAKETVGLIQYNKASKYFDKLALCGDEWMTYGSYELEKALEGQVKDISLKDITSSNSFPTRGDFLGSYKNKLDKCFSEREETACDNLLKYDNYSGEGINLSVDDLTSTKYRMYREYVYGGMEYSYGGCKDPRPERASYTGTSDKTSQLYYFRGMEPANFACDRFLVQTTEDYQEAYKCCLEASQSLICVRMKDFGKSRNEETHVMCNILTEGDGDCGIGDRESSTQVTPEDIEKMFEVLDTVEGEIGDAVKKVEESEKEEENSDQIGDIQEETSINNQIEEVSNILDGNKDKFKEIVEYASSEKSTKDVTFRIVKSTSSDGESDKYCVETYNLCPYNFKILGGTEEIGQDFVMQQSQGNLVKESNGNYIADYGDSNNEIIAELEKNDAALNCEYDKDGNRTCYGYCFDGKTMYSCFNKPSNFCQVDRHCTYIKKLYPKEDTQVSPYISKACIDFVGSSHNFDNYVTPRSATSSRSFTAPIVECMVETFKNMLFNKAGHTRCLSSTEQPYDNLSCYSGEAYVEGQDLEQYGYESPFKKLQQYVIDIMKVILAFAIVLYGFSMIMKNEGFDAVSILKFVMSAAVVCYFSLTTNWTNYVFNGVYTVSNYIIEFSMKIMDINNYSSDSMSIYNNPSYPGCYFFQHDEIANNYEQYGNKSYLAVFDTLDCKISRYFGYSGNDLLLNPPIVSLFIAGFFTLGYAVLTIIPFLLIVAAIFFIAVKIAYQFIYYSLELTLLLFFAPIMIPLFMLKKTKGFFDNWIKNITSSIFKPMFTIISTMLFLILFDKYFIGDAKFYGIREPIRDVYCGKICKISDTNFYYIPEGSDTSEANRTCIDESKGEVIDLSKESLICASMFKNKTANANTNFFDIVISGFAGFPALVEDSLDFFTMFSNLMFLLIIIFIFDKFISETSGFIFGNMEGIDLKLSDVSNKTASVMAKIANRSANIAKAAIKNRFMLPKAKQDIKNYLKDTFGMTTKEERKERNSLLSLYSKTSDKIQGKDSDSGSGGGSSSNSQGSDGNASQSGTQGSGGNGNGNGSSNGGSSNGNK